MLNDLFIENSPGQNACQTPDSPPNKRANSGLCGIKNQGATCYLNSLIQTLFHTTEFRNNLFKISAEELGYEVSSVYDPNAKRSRVIPIQLQLLFARMLYLNQDACDTESLTKSFGWENTEHFQQHDVQELCRLLFDAITVSLKGTSGYDIIMKLFKGGIVNRIFCCECKNETENKEEFLDLTISLINTENLSQALTNMFDSRESMNGGNQYYCLKCNNLRNAEKYSKIKVLPGILTFSFLRFNFDYKRLVRYKENGKFKFPLRLNMKPYLDDMGDNECEYELYSIIIHSGSAHGGHYHAYICDTDNIGNAPQEYKFFEDKNSINFLNDVELGSGDKNSETTSNLVAVDVITYIIAMHGGSEVTLAQIGESLLQECGSSWNKMYRKSHGTMLKFINSHKDIFFYNPTSKSVSLCVYDKVTNNKNASMVNKNEQSLPSKVSNSVDTSDFGCNYKDNRVWWDFNDSNIQPVTFREIEKQYEGRESAYMVFYRRLTAVTNLHVSDLNLPLHLKLEMENENLELEQMRIEHELKQNSITVFLYTTKMFNYTKGLIVLKDGINPIEISVLKSDKLAKLYKKITSEIQNSQEPNELKVNEKKEFFAVMRVLPHGGMHLYESVNFNLNLSIEESILKQNVNIMQWNGETIAGEKIVQGPLYEPINLKISFMCNNWTTQSFTLDLCCVTYANLCLIEILNNLFEIFEIKNSSYKISKANVDNILCENNYYFSESEIETKPLKELLNDYSNDVCILAEFPFLTQEIQENLSNEMHEFNINLSADILKVITKRANAFFGLHLYDINSIIKVDRKSIMLFVKQSFSRLLHIKQLGFNNTCLDMQINDMKIPSSENKCISDHLSQVNFTSVILNLGVPLMEKDVCTLVFVNKGVNINRNFHKHNKKICILQSNKTVKENVEKIRNELNLVSAKNYHLRYVLNEKDVGEIIDNEGLLHTTNITYLSKLLLCEGNIVPDDILQIPIWNYPCKLVLNFSEHKIFEKNVLPTSPKFLGYIDVSKTSTLYDIKEALLKLKEFENCNTEELCIRNVQYDVCTKIYTNDAISIKRMRFGPTVPIAVQKWPIAHFPDKNQVILSAYFHIAGTREYIYSHDVVWNNQTDVTLNNFISELIGEPVTVAKFVHASNEWIVIRSSEVIEIGKKHTKTSKSKKNGKWKGKYNKNHYFQDGDIIGIKINSKEENMENALHLDDFDRSQDIKARKLKQTENNTKPAEVPFNKDEDNSKKEATLKIHVHNFE